MRRWAFVAIMILGAASALAASPEDAYWRARLEAIARLRALGAEKADRDVIDKVEAVAREALRRLLVGVVGPVKVEGYSDVGTTNDAELTEGRSIGQIAGLVFSAREPGAGGSLVVTTERLLRRWLVEAPRTQGLRTSDAPLHALATDAFYGPAVHSGEGFTAIADIKLPKPEGASFALAKFGRWGPHTYGQTSPALIVTVVKEGRAFIALGRSSMKLPENPACAKKAASSEARDGDAFDLWRNCERKKLAQEPYFKALKREAQEISERLARAP